MPRFSSEHLCIEWTAINQRFSADIRQSVVDFFPSARGPVVRSLLSRNAARPVRIAVSVQR